MLAEDYRTNASSSLRQMTVSTNVLKGKYSIFAAEVHAQIKSKIVHWVLWREGISHLTFAQSEIRYFTLLTSGVHLSCRDKEGTSASCLPSSNLPFQKGSSLKHAHPLASTPPQPIEKPGFWMGTSRGSLQCHTLTMTSQRPAITLPMNEQID